MLLRELNARIHRRSDMETLCPAGGSLTSDWFFMAKRAEVGGEVMRMRVSDNTSMQLSCCGGIGRTRTTTCAMRTVRVREAVRGVRARTATEHSQAMM